MNLLIIPDSHSKPGVSNERFTWLGRLAADWRPDVIIHLGDAWDMPSLSSYDVGKKSFEGRSYKADLAAGHEAFDLLDKEIIGVREAGKRDEKRGMYHPRKIILGGNHDEGRVKRVVEFDRKLDGTIGVDDFKHPGWEWQPFLSALNVEGVFFSHYFISGVLGRPIGGENPATTLLNKQHRSCIAGHLHLYSYAERTDVEGKRLQAIVAGCFLGEGQYEAYAGPANGMWSNCVTKLHDVKDGTFDLEKVSLDRLKKLYS